MTCNLNIVPVGWTFCPKIEAVKTTRPTLMPKRVPSVSSSLKRVTSSPSEPPQLLGGVDNNNKEMPVCTTMGMEANRQSVSEGLVKIIQHLLVC